MSDTTDPVVARQRAAWNRRDQARRALTRPVRMRLIDEAAARCSYCGGQGTADPWWDSRGPDGRRWHFDHRDPISRGGADGLANVALACGTCNLVKADRTVDELVEYLAENASVTRYTEHRAQMLAHLLGEQ